METVLLVAHLLIALALVGVVLLQRSEGGGLGIGGGSGGGMGSLFSARGTANALTRTTAILAVLFMCTSLGLAIAAKQSNPTSSVLDDAVVPPPAATEPVAEEPMVPAPE